MKEKLRVINRALLELILGILVSGMVMLAIVITAALANKSNVLSWSLSLLIGVIMSVIASLHMYKTLDNGLEYGEGAQKKIFAGYMIRYVSLAIAFTLIALTKYLNPLVSFIGYMSLKTGAYLQPLTHKFTNKYFNETDPIPMSLEELEALEAQENIDNNSEV